MSNMYREYERAVTGRSGEGLSFMGWITVALGTLFALGAVGAGLAAVHLHNRVEHVARTVVRELDVRPAVLAAEAVTRMESHTRLLSLDPGEGLTYLDDIPMDAPPEDFFREVVGGDLWRSLGGERVTQAFREVEKRGSAAIQGGEGEVKIDLVRGDDGGSLVIRSGEEAVRFDLVKTDRGGSLAIDSRDGQVRFDLVKTDQGGSLILHSREGEVRFDLVEGEDGGALVVRSDEGTLRFGAGEAAEPMPGWVPRMEGMPSRPRGVYSLTAADGSLGAVTWQSDASTGEVLEYYRGVLEGDGYELKARQRLRNQEGSQGSLWARNQATGRLVFVVADQAQGETKVLLGYGEGRN